ncbi:hypothetical protein [Breoghania sp.]|uniref:hypothetical protein n=1 Tax=Breoghania sp. TaxID=2065378 RepID=UPI002AAB0CB0|nr:hypothetical protein [Breoghania sp.]
MHLIAHIGTGKTGSSSIQAALCQYASSGLGDYQHCIIGHGGEVATSETLRRLAHDHIVGYAPSRADPTGDECNRRKIASGIREIVSAGRIPILSHENWANIGPKFEDTDFWASIGANRPTTYVYVRPPVEYLNAAWWQWLRWYRRYEDPEAVLKAWGGGFIDWWKLLAPWRRISQLNVRLHSKDNTRDFFSLLGLTLPDETTRFNVSMTEDLIRIYDAIPEIRAPHDSVHDALLRSIAGNGPRAPWAVPRHLAAHVIDATRDDNMLLAASLSPDQREAMLADARWWDAAAYDEDYEKMRPIKPMDRHVAEDLVRRTAPYVYNRIRQTSEAQAAPS